MSSDLRKWDNNIYEFDVTKASRAMNPWLDNYGMDRFTYTPEMTYVSTAVLKRSEPKVAHGYPRTTYL